MSVIALMLLIVVGVDFLLALLLSLVHSIQLGAQVVVIADLLVVPALLLVQRQGRRLFERRWECGKAYLLTSEQAHVSSKRFTVAESLRRCPDCGSESFADRRVSRRNPASPDASAARLPEKRWIPRTDSSGPRRWWRFLRPTDGLAVLAVALAGAGIGWLIYGATYQPLQPGPFAGPGQSMKQITDGTRSTAFILIGRTGTIGAVEFSLQTGGSTAVRLLGLADDSYPGVQLRWGPATDQNRVMGGTFAESKPFPVNLAPGELIGLWIIVRKPGCANGSTQEISSIGIRWQSLGFNHVYEFSFGPSMFYRSPFLPIDVCYPASALKHVK